MSLLRFVQRKSANLAEYLRPAYLASVARGDSRQEQDLIRRQNRPSQPETLKQATVRSYAERHGCRVLVETGTYQGDMLHAMLLVFDRLYSIELGHGLHAAAVERFRPFPRVKLFEGDSGTVLPRILAELNAPALFWLDAHYSKGVTAKGDLETPIEAELRAILAHPVKEHVILIDDAREFGKRQDYPPVERIRAQVAAAYKHFEVGEDIIRIFNDPPPRA